MKLKNVNFAVINGSSTAEAILEYLFDPGRNDFGSRSQNFTTFTIFGHMSRSLSATNLFSTHLKENQN